MKSLMDCALLLISFAIYWFHVGALLAAATARKLHVCKERPWGVLCAWDIALPPRSCQKGWPSSTMGAWRLVFEPKPLVARMPSIAKEGSFSWINNTFSGNRFKMADAIWKTWNNHHWNLPKRLILARHLEDLNYRRSINKNMKLLDDFDFDY